MHPRQGAAASACRRVEREIVRTRMTTDEAFADLKHERRNPHHRYPSIESKNGI